MLGLVDKIIIEKAFQRFVCGCFMANLQIWSSMQSSFTQHFLNLGLIYNFYCQKS